MLIPQFSLRRVLGITTLCGVLSLVGKFALVDGHGWARALVLAGASLVAALAVFAWAFFVVWLFSLVMRGAGQALPRSRRSTTQSPFAPVQSPFKVSTSHVANSGPSGAPPQPQ